MFAGSSDGDMAPVGCATGFGSTSPNGPVVNTEFSAPSALIVA